ncbi:TIGR04255 family protein, partial [Paracoccus salipaludis]
RDDSYIVEFQDRIRKVYPFVERIEAVPLPIPGSAPEISGTEVHWNFSSVDKKWRVVLAANAITLETKDYNGHIDFIKRFGFILNALADTVQPTVMIRIGYRYINRLQSPEDLSNIQILVRENLIGLADAKIRENVVQSVAQSTCRTKEGGIVVHWGILPPNTAMSDLMDRLDTNSWILDIDAFTQPEQAEEFIVDKALTSLNYLSDRAYAFFRWAITEEFLKRFGG